MLFNKVIFTYEESSNTFTINGTNTTANDIDFSTTEQGTCINTNKMVDTDNNNLQKLSLGYIMGFRNKTYTTTTSHRSEAQYSRYGLRYFVLYVNDYTNNHKGSVITSFEENTMGDNNQLAMIKFNVDSTDKIVDVEAVHETLRVYSGKSDISRLHIRLLDEYGRIVDLAGMDFSFALEIGYDE